MSRIFLQGELRSGDRTCRQFLRGVTWKGCREAGQTLGEEMFCFGCFISIREQLEWEFSIRKWEIEDTGKVENY